MMIRSLLFQYLVVHNGLQFCRIFIDNLYDAYSTDGGRSSSEPPYHDEEPEDDNKEDDVPEPAATLTSGHGVHAAEGAC